ncbi:MAG: hypothetical protein WCR45_05155 [Bacteroidaceae bacterium]|nr:hypothetical protein [Bacteroidaceae bacterium]
MEFLSHVFGFPSDKLSCFDISLDKDTTKFMNMGSIAVFKDDPDIKPINDCLNNFWLTVISECSTNPDDINEYLSTLFSPFTEPKENKLGYSHDSLHGNCIGDILKDSFVQAIQNIPLIEDSKSMLFVAPFLENIGNDRLSDITTRIAYLPLQQYTLKICKKYNYRDLRPTKVTFWDDTANKWKEDSLLLPYYGANPFLLTPKILVSSQVEWSSFSGAIKNAVVYYIQQYIKESEFASYFDEKRCFPSIKKIIEIIISRYKTLHEFCSRNIDYYTTDYKYKMKDILDFYFIHKFTQKTKKKNHRI